MAASFRKKRSNVDLVLQDARGATAHGGQLIVDALAKDFGLWEKIRACVCMDRRKDKSRGFSPEAIVAQMLFPHFLFSKTGSHSKPGGHRFALRKRRAGRAGTLLCRQCFQRGQIPHPARRTGLGMVGELQQMGIHAHRLRARICIPKAAMRWWRLFLADHNPKLKLGRPAKEPDLDLVQN